MSSTSRNLTRRSAMFATASLPLAAATTGTAFAAAEMMGAATARFNRVKLGAFEVTTLLAGTRTVPDPQNIFGMNATNEEFAEASAKANISAEKAQFFFTPTVVNTGEKLVLFDTGLNAGGISGVLKAAGYLPEQIDTVVITHMHGDHIGGLMNEANPTFSNADYVTGQVEFDTWSKMDNQGFEKNMRPLAEKTRMVKGGDTVAPGITAMEAFGHTPGHMAYMIDSKGQQLVLAADFANHYVWSLSYPDWEVKFDNDKAAAAKTRRKLLDMIATDKIPFVGYHMPFPAIGYVENRDQGFHYLPSSYQLMMD